LYEERDMEPPCERCYVELDEENKEVMDLYLKVRNQVRLSPMGDIIGLDYNALNFIMDIYGIENKRDMFEKMLVCFAIDRELSK